MHNRHIRLKVNDDSGSSSPVLAWRGIEVAPDMPVSVAAFPGPAPIVPRGRAGIPGQSRLRGGSG